MVVADEAQFWQIDIFEMSFTPPVNWFSLMGPYQTLVSAGGSLDRRGVGWPVIISILFFLLGGGKRKTSESRGRFFFLVGLLKDLWFMYVGQIIKRHWGFCLRQELPV